MPPSGSKRPDDVTTDALIQILKTELDRVAASKPNPGKPVLRHLNRVEYSNAIRDLLALEVDTR
jgi:hypothetical protein